MHPFSEAVSTAAGKEVKEKPEPLALKSETHTEGANPDRGANAWNRTGTRFGHLHGAESDPDAPNLWRQNRI